MAQSKTRAKFMPVKHANPAFSPSVSKQVLALKAWSILFILSS
jgi:hypothetical protein